jgi:hypothetical protein
MTDIYAQPGSDPRMHLRPVTILLAAFGAATVAAAIGCLFTSAATYAVTGFAACAVVTAPMVQRAYQLLSPWTLMAVIVYDACGLRGLVMALGISGGGISNRDFFLLGHSPSYFWWPSVLYVGALALIAAAYMTVVSGNGSHETSRKAAAARASLHRFHAHVGLVVAAFAVFGFLAFVWYVHGSGGLTTLSSCSAQPGADGIVRTGGWGVRLSAGYSGNGVSRALNVFSTVAFWIYLVHVLGKSSTRLWSGRTLAALTLLANALLLPIYSSSRSDVGFMALVSIAIFLAMRPSSRDRWRVIRNVGLFALVLVAAMTFVRAYGCNTPSDQVSGQSTDLPSTTHGRGSPPLVERITRPVSRVLVYNRNHGDMFTASHIVHAVPDDLPYAYGRTIATWFVTPIPRSLWPDRPHASSGVEIGEAIYGNGRVSVPPGFVGELYWNFGIGGVLVGSLLLGCLMGELHRRFRRWPHGDPVGTLGMAAISFPLGAYVMEQGVGGGLFRWLVRAIALAVVYLLSTAWLADRLRRGSDASAVVHEGERVTPSRRD